MCGKIPQMIQQFGEEFELNIIKQHLARDIKKRNHEFTNYCTKAREPFKPFFFVILKPLKNTLQHFKFVNWFLFLFVFN